MIASSIGALAELIRPGVNGFVFDPGQPESLARVIKRFEDSDVGELRIEARRSYEAKYTEQQSLDGLLKIYRDVTGSVDAQPQDELEPLAI